MDATTKNTHAADGLPPGQRFWAALAVSCTIFLAVLDAAIANIALPVIATDLKATPADVIWVVNSYQIAVVATLLPLAALGEIIGIRRVYISGLALFVIASLCCALSWSLPTLVVARTFQGFGAAGIMSLNAALLRTIFPSGRLGRAFGRNAVVVATAFAVGPTVASSILSVATWPWLFAVNVPLGLVAFAIGTKTLPYNELATHRFDFRGAVLTAGGIAMVVFGLNTAAHMTSGSLAAAEIVGGVLLGWLALRRQAGHPAPILPIDLFRRPMFALSAMTGVLAFMAQGMSFVALPFYFEGVLHRSAVQSGFFMTPWPLAVGLMAPIAGRLADRYPVAILGALGMAIAAIGLGLLAALPANPGDADIIWRMALGGIGFGFFQSPNLRSIMASALPGRSGGASGVIASARLVGQSTGAASAALCFVLLGDAGATWALAVSAGLAAIGCIMSAVRLTVD